MRLWRMNLRASIAPAKAFLLDRFAIDPSEASGLVAVVPRRHHVIDALVSSLSMITAFFAWMFMFGRGTDALEGTRWDILATARTFGDAGLVLIILAGYGIAIALAWSSMPRCTAGGCSGASAASSKRTRACTAGIRCST